MNRAQKKVRASQLEEIQFQAEWTRRALAELVERVYVVEQIYYRAIENTKVQYPFDEVFEKATRRLGEDAKRVAEEAKTWGLGELSQPSEALVGLRLMA
jgi:hypothetical protein